jgi:hypothetical protein|tara:strand:- start:918 stop:1586 length:669 start_codon:yes stop_codon:yes gene_type:complete
MYEETINGFKKVLGENLVSAVKFGTEGQPNNLLFVLKRLDFDILEKIKPLVMECTKKNKVVPLFFTQEELRDGSDVFPLEFLDIKNPHEVLYGDDLIKEIKFDKKHVRRQLEFELRSKLIHLRENYIWIKKPRGLRELLKRTIPSTMPLFYGLLFLKDVEAPTELDELLRVVAENYKVDVGVLRKIKKINEVKAKDEELKVYVRELMAFLTELGDIVDEIKL